MIYIALIFIAFQYYNNTFFEKEYYNNTNKLFKCDEYSDDKYGN